MISEHKNQLEDIANNLKWERDSFYTVGTNANIPRHVLDIVYDLFEFLSDTLKKMYEYY